MAKENAEVLVDNGSVGTVTEVVGEAYIVHADGSREVATKGAEIQQGDTIETGSDGAVNLLFADNSSFAVSESAKMGIDEFTFDGAEQTGTSFFSMVQGVFVYTSGLIGKSDPGDVNIDTPVGSIGIRGTVIAGDIKPEGSGQESSVTILDGAIALTNASGTHEINSQFDTIALKSYNDMPSFAGKMDSASFNKTFSKLSNVANDTVNKFGGGGDNANAQKGNDNAGNDAAGAEATAEGKVDGEGEAQPEGEGKPEGPDEGAAKEMQDPALRQEAMQEAINDPGMKEAMQDATVKEGMVREAMQDQAMREQMAKEKMLDGEMGPRGDEAMMMDPAMGPDMMMRDPMMKDPAMRDGTDPFRDPNFGDPNIPGADGNNPDGTYDPAFNAPPTGTDPNGGTDPATGANGNDTTGGSNYLAPIEFHFHPEYFNTNVMPGGPGAPEYGHEGLDLGHIVSPLGLNFTSFTIMNGSMDVGRYDGTHTTTDLDNVLEINADGKLLVKGGDAWKSLNHEANPDGFDVTIKATDNLGHEHLITKHIEIRDYQPGVTPDISGSVLPGDAGNANAEFLVATNTSTTIQSTSNIGTGDVAIGLEGSNAFSIISNDFHYISGGQYTPDTSDTNYHDKLILADDNLHLNFQNFNEVRVDGIEKIEFGAMNTKISLGIKDIFDITDGGGELKLLTDSYTGELNINVQGLTKEIVNVNNVYKYSGSFNGEQVTLIVDGTSNDITVNEHGPGAGSSYTIG